MSATAIKTNQAVAEWVRLFPRQATETYASSQTFMKQLTIVAISTITYLKNVFPEDSYTIETFGGIKLRILKKKCRHELPQFVSTALAQAFEAFEKKYLHQLVLCFYDGECKAENLMEYHIFEYAYNTEGVTMNVHSKSADNTRRSTKYTFENVKERTLQMIRSCVVIMQACQNEMPDSYDVSLRLYYNEDAPEDYQAPGFSSCAEGQEHLRGAGESVRLGCVETPFHKLTTRAYIKDPIASSREVNPSENAPVMSQNAHDDFDECSSRWSASDSTSARVLCPCNLAHTDDPLYVLITCQYCNTQQHAACFGVTRAAAVARQYHCCCLCADADSSRVPTDMKLMGLNARKRACLCIFRRALCWCESRGAVAARDFVHKFGVTQLSAQRLLKLLHYNGVIQLGADDDLHSSCPVIPDKLKQIISIYFYSDESAFVDRLITETIQFHYSQDSQPDPIGDVLSPMEKVSLQNETTICKVVEPTPVPTNTNVDETLNQYRDAIMSNITETEELPLSGNTPMDVEKSEGKGGKRKLNWPKRTGVRTKRARASHD